MPRKKLLRPSPPPAAHEEHEKEQEEPKRPLRLPTATAGPAPRTIIPVRREVQPDKVAGLGRYKITPIAPPLAVEPAPVVVEKEEPEPELALRPFRQVFAAVLAYRLAYAFLIYLCIALLPISFQERNYFGNIHHGDELPGVIERHLMTWDAQPYLWIAESGYGGDKRLAAFYPLWPFLVQWLSGVLGGNYLLGALILANVFSTLAFVLLHRYISEIRGTTTADRAVLLLLAFPGALFLALPYTEGLFLLLSAGIFLCLTRSRFFGAGFFGFLVALSRPTGVLWAVPMAVDAFRKKRWKDMLFALLPIAGFGCYLLMMRVLAGNAGAGLAAQSYFLAKSSIAKVFDFAGFTHTFFQPLHIHGVFDSFIDRVWFVWFLASLYFIWRRDRTLFAYSFVMGLVPAMTVSMMAYTRYMLVVIPVFITAAGFFETDRRRLFFPILLAVLFGLQLIFLILQINCYWVA
jgi:hypothetical protein